MVLKPDQQRIRDLLSETITLLCRNGLHFESQFSIDALIGITLDVDDVFLVSIKETVHSESKHTSSEDCTDQRLQSQSDQRPQSQNDHRPQTHSDQRSQGHSNHRSQEQIERPDCRLVDLDWENMKMCTNKKSKSGGDLRKAKTCQKVKHFTNYKSICNTNVSNTTSTSYKGKRVQLTASPDAIKRRCIAEVKNHCEEESESTVKHDINDLVNADGKKASFETNILTRSSKDEINDEQNGSSNCDIVDKNTSGLSCFNPPLDTSTEAVFETNQHFESSLRDYDEVSFSNEDDDIRFIKEEPLSDSPPDCIKSNVRTGQLDDCTNNSLRSVHVGDCTNNSLRLFQLGDCNNSLRSGQSANDDSCKLSEFWTPHLLHSQQVCFILDLNYKSACV